MLTPGPGPGPVNILPRLSHHARYSPKRHETAYEGKYLGSNKTAQMKSPRVCRPTLLWVLAANPNYSTCIFPVQEEVVKVKNKLQASDLRGTGYLEYHGIAHIVNNYISVDALRGVAGRHYG